MQWHGTERFAPWKFLVEYPIENVPECLSQVLVNWSHYKLQDLVVVSTFEMDQARHWFGHFWAKLTRRKVIREDLMKTNLKRTLSPFAVIAIGIGQMAGGGAFVVLGKFKHFPFQIPKLSWRSIGLTVEAE